MKTSRKFILANMSILKLESSISIISIISNISNDLTAPSIRIESFATINLRGVSTRKRNLQHRTILHRLQHAIKLSRKLQKVFPGIFWVVKGPKKPTISFMAGKTKSFQFGDVCGN